MKYIIDLDKLQHEDDICELEYYCQRYGTPLSEELEKIRAEITACTQQEEGEVPDCINYGIKLSTEIVEKHISKLKGENNAEIILCKD